MLSSFTFLVGGLAFVCLVFTLPLSSRIIPLWRSGWEPSAKRKKLSASTAAVNVIIRGCRSEWVGNSGRSWGRSTTAFFPLSQTYFLPRALAQMERPSGFPIFRSVRVSVIEEVWLAGDHPAFCGGALAHKIVPQTKIGLGRASAVMIAFPIRSCGRTPFDRIE